MTMNATVESIDDAWVLTLERQFAYTNAAVWPWLTQPTHLVRWSPIVPDLPFDAPGPRQIRENSDDDPQNGEVLAIDAPHQLVHRWGSAIVGWRLTPTASGCTLRVKQTMRRRSLAPMNAAGWDVCLTVLDELLGGTDTPRATGPAIVDRGWATLRADYAELLGL